MQTVGWTMDRTADRLGLSAGEEACSVPLTVLLDWSEQLRAATVELRAACMEARAHARDLRLRTSGRARPEA